MTGTQEILGSFAGYGVRDPEGAGSAPPVELGDCKRFKPAAYATGVAGFGAELNVTVTGTVVQIHREHRWYRVRYEHPYGIGYECFKF